MEVIFDMPLKVTHCFSLIHFYFSVNQGFKEIIDRPNISFRLCYPFNDHYLFNDDLKSRLALHIHTEIEIYIYICAYQGLVIYFYF